MSSHQIHFERKFYQDKTTGYWISCDYTKDRPRVRAHQWVWQNYNGKPPKGYHIHHMNDDKSDNRIENLELIRGKRHLEHHMIERLKNPEIRQKLIENCERIRPLTKSWHASPEGKAWHKYHALKCNFGNGPSFDYTCQQCLKSYQSKLKAKGRTRFCSNACKSTCRRKEGLDNITKVCPICNKEFFSNKYAKKETCGMNCGAKFRWKMKK